MSFGFVESSWVFFSACLVLWIVRLLLVMNRLIFHDPLPGGMAPTLAILIAPPVATFLSGLQPNGGVLDAAVRMFCGKTLVFTGLGPTQSGKRWRLPSAVSCRALNFPVAALTISTSRLGALAQSQAHVMAGYLLLSAFVLIVGARLAQTTQRVTRRKICQPG